jgi:hypothetical protein
MLENTEGVKHVFVLCLVYPMLPVSLDCPFTLPLGYSLTCICPVSCVSYVNSFSGLSFYITTSVRIPKRKCKRTIQRNWQHRIHKTQDKYILENTEGVKKKDNPEKLATPLRYSLKFICPVSCVSYVASFSGLSFFISPSYSLTFICPVSCVPYVAKGNTKGQSRETGSIGYTRHRTNKC